MFEKLKSAFTSLASSISQRTLSAADLEGPLWDFELALIESDVAQEVASSLSQTIRKELLGRKLDRNLDVEEFVKDRLRAAIQSTFLKAGTIDIVSSAKWKASRGERLVIIFLGINGTGKTTTVAKFANLIKKQRLSVVVACADTHRAGAIEQLSQHAANLSIKVIAQKYGADPAAVARDAVLHAESNRINVVLVDTAGRMQTSKNLMEEVKKINRVVNPDYKIFVGDSLAGNDAVSQAQEFLSYTNFDAAILTKADADTKGGAALSIVYATGKPIIYLGTGQGYDDLSPFSPSDFANSLLD